MTSVTQLIDSVRKGEAGASDLLLEAVYDELYEMAHRQFSQDHAGHTLQTTALVNEAFLRLFGKDSNPQWENRAHFFSAAAEAMRRILVDHARRKKAIKRGRNHQRVGLNDDTLCTEPVIDEVLDINHALDALAIEHAEKAELVKLRYFVGLTISQAAKVLQISIPTANRHWAFARAWLIDRIQNQ